MDIPQGGIAFFDSGIGGLTVLSACLKTCGGLPVYYYGDNFRAPYGNLPPETILAYAQEAFDLFAALKVRAAVIACNTVTAVCAETFRRQYPFPIIGAEPAVFPAAKRGGQIFVLATRATANSLRLQSLCARALEKYPQAAIRVFPCDELAGAVERGVLEPDFDFTPYFPNGTPSAVVLGCTHYVFLRSQVEAFYGCPVYDGNDGIARRLASILSQRGEANDSSPFVRETRPLKTTFSLNSSSSTTAAPSSSPNAATDRKTPNIAGIAGELLCFSSKNVGALRGEPLVFNSREPKAENTKMKETNICSCIFFLGSGKKANKVTFEQMFV